MHNRSNPPLVPSSRQLYNVKQACQKLNIGKTLLYVLVTEGKLHVVKIGSRTLFAEDELERFIDSLKGVAA